MSKGGAGKVYFVLYLAVILELLIIIVERDEAEEHLMKKQQESMRIVESILTQLQSGAGTEGINTRPQDAIVIADNLPEEQRKLFKKFRTYFIEVGVTDVASNTNTEGMDEAQKNEKIEINKKLANVQELQYEIYYNPSKELTAPDSPTSDKYKLVEKSPQVGMKLENPNASSTEAWELIATKKLVLDPKSMKDYSEPVYSDSPIKAGNVNEYAPSDSANANRVFAYSKEKTDKLKSIKGGKLNKRAFVCNFEPKDGNKAGWYKLRFSSQTNRILGISGGNIASLKDDQKVSIGTVQLKVKDLKNVLRHLSEELAQKSISLPSLESFGGKSTGDDPAANEKAVDELNSTIEKAKEAVQGTADEKTQLQSRIDLYGYIMKLLSPGQYKSFDQNKGSIEIDIFVQKPDIEQGQPVISWDGNQTAEGVQIYSFDRAERYIATFEASMYDKLTPTVTFTGGNVKVDKIKGSADASGKKGKYRVEYVGSLKSGDYKFTASLKSGKNEDVQNITLKVFPTGLLKTGGDESSPESNAQITENAKAFPGEDELNGLLGELIKGQEIEFSVTPTSENFIPQNQFRIIMTGIKKKPLTNTDDKKSESESGSPNLEPVPTVGLRITPNMQLFVPFESEQVTTKILWVDPMDPQSNIVQIYPSDNSPAFVSKVVLPIPIITKVEKTSIVNIANPKKPTFDIAFKVKSPVDVAKLSTPKLEIKSQTLNKKNFRIELINQTKSGENYVFSFAVVGKPGVPIPKGLNGSLKFAVSATLTYAGQNSNNTKPFEYSIMF